MRKVLTDEDAIKRPYLVEYDVADPSPQFSADQIRYIQSIPKNLSGKALEKLRETEWFILNLNSNLLIECAIPGLRTQPKLEVVYIKRFSKCTYADMILRFMDVVRRDLPHDQIDRWIPPRYRLTSINDEKFYPIEYNGNLPAWRKEFARSAQFLRSSLGHFEQGELVVSDGRTYDLGDMDIAWVGPEPDPPDW